MTRFFGVGYFLTLGILYIPISLFFANIVSLSFDLSLLLAPLTVSAILFIPLLLFVRKFPVLNFVLAGLGISIFVCDLLLRGNYHLLDGNNVPATQNLIAVTLNALIYLGVPIVLVYFRERVERQLKEMCIPVCSAVIVGYAALATYSGATLNDFGSAGIAEDVVVYDAKQPNIYFVVLDALDGNSFNLSLKDPPFSRSFSGFTSFTQNTANYLYTNFSFASFMSGTFIQGSPEEEIFTGTGEIKKITALPDLLQANGYRVSAYTQSRFLSGDENFSITDVEVYEEATNFSGLNFDFIVSWLMRSLPSATLLRSSEIRRIAEKTLLASARSSGTAPDFPKSTEDGIGPFTGVKILEKAIDDEEARESYGEFVFIHAIIPHGPYRISSNCEFRETHTSYTEQQACALSLTANFLLELERLGRYDGSFIVVMGDHGSGWESVTSTVGNITVLKPDIKPWTTAQIESRVHTGLMIKPPFAGDFGKKPAVFSSSETQLIDVFPTVVEHLGLSIQPMHPVAGRNVFQEPQEVRSKSFFYFTPTNGKIPKPAYQFELVFDSENNRFSINNEVDVSGGRRYFCDQPSLFTNNVVATGLSDVEGVGRWSESSTVHVAVPLADACEPVRIIVRANALVTSEYPVQSASVAVNEVPVGKMEIRHGELAPKTFIFNLPESVSRELDIRFEIDAPVTPKSLGINQDERELGFSFRSLELGSSR